MVQRKGCRSGFVLVLVLLVLWFLSCARTESEIVFMIGGAPDELQYWEKLIKEFQADAGFRVRIIRGPTDSDQRRQGLVIPLRSQQEDPDVFLMDVVWIGQFVAAGWLEPLDTHISNSRFSVEPFFEGVINLADEHGDTLFALPVYVDGGLLYYRRDLLAEYGYDGPPETWGELVDCSLVIQEGQRKVDPEFYGFAWQGAQYEGLVCTFLEFSASNGGGILRDQEISVNTTENVEALEFMRDLIHRHEISPPNTFTEMKEEEVRSFFQRGKALFERNWPYAWKLHESAESPVAGKVGIASLPHFKDGKSVSALGGWHVGISRHSDAKERSWELVRFITSYETEKKLVLNLGWNPGRRDVYQDQEIKDRFPHLGILSGIFENAVPRPNLPYYTQLSEVIQRHVNGCLSGKVEPHQALRRMQAEVEDLTRMYHEK